MKVCINKQPLPKKAETKTTLVLFLKVGDFLHQQIFDPGRSVYVRSPDLRFQEPHLSTTCTNSSLCNQCKKTFPRNVWDLSTFSYTQKCV